MAKTFLEAVKAVYNDLHSSFDFANYLRRCLPNLHGVYRPQMPERVRRLSTRPRHSQQLH